MAAFVVKANLDDRRSRPWQIFRGTMPMTMTMVLVLLICVFFPWLALGMIGGTTWNWW